ncbi:MAG: hypothetical protein AB1646_03310 [Thermodesulfobacteriota bacterium]
MSAPQGGTVKFYDPQRAPDSAKWLALDDDEKRMLVEKYHQAKRLTAPNTIMHAVLHVVVENQIAERFDPTVRAMARLRNEDLSRHDALHAVGCVVLEHLSELIRKKGKDLAGTSEGALAAALDRLTVDEWHRRYGG